MGQASPLSASPASHVLVPVDLWTRLVFAAKNSEDARFTSLMEQGVMEARVAFEPGSLPLKVEP
jgi:hypothetical protein